MSTHIHWVLEKSRRIRRLRNYYFRIQAHRLPSENSRHIALEYLAGPRWVKIVVKLYSLMLPGMEMLQ